MYRPKNWKNPYGEEQIKEISPTTMAVQMKDGRCYRDKQIVRMLEHRYEAGADAMLTALEPLIRKIAPSSKLIDILYGGKE